MTQQTAFIDEAVNLPTDVWERAYKATFWDMMAFGRGCARINKDGSIEPVSPNDVPPLDGTSARKRERRAR